MQQSHNQVKQGTLASTVLAKQSIDITLLEIKREVLQHRTLLPIGKGKVLNSYHSVIV
jgi:hypothetical protein